MELHSGSDLISNARTEGGSLVIAVRGEIDMHNAPELRTEVFDLITKHPTKRLILNLASVPYMDSSACAVFVESMRRVRAVGGKVYLVALQPRVRSLLEIAHLLTIFVVVKDEAEALA